MYQLGLNIHLKEWAVFDSYVAGPNQAVVHYLSTIAGHSDPVVWIWGRPSVGKTHLLQASCKNQSDSVFIPCHGWEDLGYEPTLLSELGALPLVCIDDVGEIAGNRSWEEALLVLVNEIKDTGGTLLVSSRLPPTEVAFELPDVHSRLRWGPVFRVSTLTDEQVAQALKLRAGSRGLVLPEDTLTYLMRHHSRDQRQLFELLNRLDVESLAAQRRLTIPFVKSVLHSTR
ncbi:MAG: DnaA regulatory inactivator Hda [Pseudomonadota bacterium]